MREKDSENGHRCGDGTSKEDEKGRILVTLRKLDWEEASYNS